MHKALREIIYTGNSHVCLQDTFRCLRMPEKKRDAAHLIGVSHADVPLILSWHVAMDGVDVLWADQTIHWMANTEQEPITVFQFTWALDQISAFFTLIWQKSPLHWLLISLLVLILLQHIHVNHCLQYKSLWVCSMVQIWLKIQHFVRKIMLISNRDSY